MNKETQSSTHFKSELEWDLSTNATSLGPRSDSEIGRAVATALRWHDSVPADRLTVHVKEGWVTLTGEVDWEYQRAAASNLARPLNGVVGIINRIELKPAPRRKTSENATAMR